jgi:hypothetical protein
MKAKMTSSTAPIIFAGLLNIAQIAVFTFFLASNTTDNLPLIVLLIIAPLVNLIVLTKR